MAQSPSVQVAPVPAQLMLVRTATCKKISSRASGSIEYRVAYAPDKSDVFISISANIGGGGYFSKEWIPASRIATCFAQLPGEQAVFATKQLRELFIGRSVNNPPFIAAVLRAEGLLAAAAENEVQHQLSGKLDEWRKHVLKQKGASSVFLLNRIWRFITTGLLNNNSAWCRKVRWEVQILGSAHSDLHTLHIV